MGWGKKKRDAFRSANPICCYCATSPTETTDHNPSRECFKDGIGPDGFSFPSCYRCNNGTGQLEQAVALMLRRVDTNPANASSAQLAKLMDGVARYTPTMIPNEKVSVEETKEVYARYNLPIPPDHIIEGSIIGNSLDSDRALWAFGRKLTCALYWKEMKAILPLENLIFSGWQAASHPQISDIIRPAISVLPNLVRASIHNGDFGDQFSYRFAVEATTNRFMFVAKFGRALFIRGDTVPPGYVDDSPVVRAHSDDTRTMFFRNESVESMVVDGFIYG